MQNFSRVIGETAAVILRASIFGTGIIAIIASPARQLPLPQLLPLLGGALLYVILSSLCLRASGKATLSPRVISSLVAVDVLIISLLIWIASPEYGIYALLYYAPILYAAVRLDLRDCITASLLSAAAYLFIGLAYGDLTAKGWVGIGYFGISAVVFAAVVGLLSSELSAREQLAESLGASLERLTANYHLARAGGASTKEEMISRTLEEFGQLAKTPGCYLALLDKNKEFQLRTRVGEGEQDFCPEAARAALERNVPAKLRRQAGENCSEEGLETILTLPLNTIRETLGVVQIHRKDSFKPREIEALQALGVEAAQAIENASLRAELVRLATMDIVTGLPNRAEVSRQLELEIKRARRYGHHISLLMIDLDGFKAINDTLGHAVGDEVLCRLARLLQEHLRTSDMAGRWGGDEFCIILPETSLEGSLVLAERIRRAFQADSFAHIHAVHAYESSCVCSASLSIGIVSNCDGRLSADRLLAFADRALYAAKRAGKNQVKAFLVGAEDSPPKEEFALAEAAESKSKVGDKKIKGPAAESLSPDKITLSTR